METIYKIIRFFKSLIRKISTYLVMDLIAVFIAAITVVPLLWVVFTALKDQGRIISNPLGLPNVWHWENFAQAWVVGHFGRYFLNSVIVVIPTVIFILFLSILSAYAFGTMVFKLKGFLFLLFLIGLTIPLPVLIIPLFYELLSLKMLNTLWALIIPQIAAGLPFGILLLRSFIEDLPKSILESARLDGCFHWQLLRYIVAPLTGPALTALLVFNFMWVWNQFLLPVVFIQDDAARTLPVGLNFFQGRYTTNLSLLMAGATIAFLPIVVVYIIFQRQFIKGITAGAIK